MKVLIQVDFKITAPEDGFDDEGNPEQQQVTKFRSRRYEVSNTDDITDVLAKMIDDIKTQIGNSYLSSSNITIDKIDKLTIHYDKYNPTRAGSYIELPQWMSSNKACINIRNEDNKCFKYCVQCSVHKSMRKTILKE